MDQKPDRADIQERLGAAVIDQFILSGIFASVLLIASWGELARDLSIIRIIPIYTIGGYLVFCLKDLVGGVSIGKWILGIGVRNLEDGMTKPTMTKLFFRNILSFLWPLELIVLLFSRDKRKIGDKIAKTDVYIIPRKTKVFVVVIVAIIIFALIFTLMVFGFTSIVKNDDSYKAAVHYIENNSEIKKVTGDIVKYGFFIQGSVNHNYTHDTGNAGYLIKVIGEKQAVYVEIILQKEGGKDWEVVAFELHPL